MGPLNLTGIFAKTHNIKESPNGFNGGQWFIVVLYKFKNSVHR